ncbi:MAG TPA: DUF3987 domain-containing protein [Burkholderiaceae bacterium]|nr:DUF3987 domain-containing protein [Burkholderiaceae bacterium]
MLTWDGNTESATDLYASWVSHRVCVFGGKDDTHKTHDDDGIPSPHPMAGKPYRTVSMGDLMDMASKPGSKPKLQALALMASSYAQHDARKHQVQRERGQFVLIRGDIDKGNTTMAELVDALVAFAGYGVALCVYSTASATPDAPRWRVVIPLSEPLGFAEWRRLQRALHLHLAKHGIQFDGSMELAGQYMAAPNVPPDKRGDDGQPLFYESNTSGREALDVTAPGCVAALALADTEEKQAAEAREKAAKRAAERARQVQAGNTTASLIDAVNARYSVADCMRRFGFETMDSENWHHPLQTSASHSWRDYGNHWVCISSMARDHGIGMVSANGFVCGDAFDLIVHFEHGGDKDKAIKALADEITVNDPATGEVLTWNEYTRLEWKAGRSHAGETFPQVDGEPKEWPTPEPLPDALPAVQGFDDDNHRNTPRPHEGCLYGLVGDVARAAAAANKEVNPYAAALSYMVALSAGFGRGCYLTIGDDWHHPRLYALHVGRSGRGRKGTSSKLTERIVRELSEHHPDVAFKVHTGGLSSREGLVMMIHDGFKQGKNEVEPIHDKRLFIVESEFANVLHQSSREGNTLSAALRDGWDGRCIKPAVKSSPVYASKPHINMLGHITPTELLDLMKARELTNGFANRFVMIWGEQTGLDAFPGYTPKSVLTNLTDRTAEVMRFAQADRFADLDHTRIQFSDDARKRYGKLYLGELQDRKGGEHVTGLLTRRPAYLMRLAMLFALTDKSTIIQIPHLEAALHWMRYWADSVRYVFASGAQEQAAKQTSEAAIKVLDYLAKHGDATRTDLIRYCFNGRITKTVLDAALTELLRETPPAIEVEELPRKDGPGSGTKVYRKTPANSAKPANSGAAIEIDRVFASLRNVRTLRNVGQVEEPEKPDFADFADFARTENTAEGGMDNQTSHNSQTSQGVSEFANTEPALADDVEEF